MLELLTVSVPVSRGLEVVETEWEIVVQMGVEDHEVVY